MKTFIHIFMIVLAAMTSLSVRAISPEVKIRHLTVNEGLLRNAVFDIRQDDLGGIWFAGWDGLYAYDGYQIRLVCRPSFGDKDGDLAINKLAIDDYARIWMGTSSGLAYWDPVRAKARSFVFDVPGRGPKKIGITALLYDRRGNLWMGSREGDLFVWNLRQQKIFLFPRDKFHTSSLITDICEDPSGNVRVVWEKNGVYSFSPKKDAASWDITPCSDVVCFPGQETSTIFYDSKGQLWVGTNRGAFLLTTDSVTQTLSRRNIVEDCFVRSFVEINGVVYMATNQGLATYRLDQNNIVWIREDYNRMDALNDHSLQKLYADHEGGLWIASFYGGVNYISPTAGNFQNHQQINTHLGGHVVSGIAEDYQGNLWIGVEDGGLCCWDRKTDKVYNLKSGSDFLFHYATKNVQTVYCKDTYLYVGTFGQGMDIIDLRTGAQINYRKNRENPHIFNSVYSFYKDSDGGLWIGTLQGLYYSKDHKKPQRIMQIPSDCKVNGLMPDDEGNLWISTLSEGFFCLDMDTRKVRQWKYDASSAQSDIPTNEITTITPYGQSVFLGTQENGLWCYNKKDSLLTPMAPKVLGQLFIFKILPVQDYLWITTNRGLYAYHLVTGQIKQYTSHDGLRSNQFKNNSGIVTSDGLIVLGSVHGINTFRPENIRFNHVQPQVFLTGLFLQNDLVDVHSPEGVLSRSIEYTRQLTIGQKHHSIGFQFASSSYNDVSSNRFEYKLEPFDKEWQLLSEGAHSVNYTNLKAGQYIFRVRTANKDGNWSNEASVTLDVRPYWWLSVPMKMVYVLFVLAVIYWILRSYRKKHREEIRMLRIQKEQELYRSKMDFFTCMIHELRTPLTLILGPLEHVKSQILPTAPAYADLQVMERNGRRLLSLVNELMDFRKIEEKSYRLHLKTCDVGLLTNQVVADFRHEAQHKHLTLHLEQPEDLCPALIDHEAFVKVLYNLLSNAMKFAETKIEVALKESSDHHFWMLTVCDDGPGIDPQQQTQVFEAFYQVDHERMNVSGTGIGLFVARRLIELQNGSIHIVPQTDKGCCFEILLPKHDGDAAALQDVSGDEAEGMLQQPPVETDLPLSLPEESKRRLLIVEDHKEMQEYIRSLFVPDYLVDVCDNGQLALEKIHQVYYDLIITDLMMPVMGGVELCGAIKNDLAISHIPVLMLTAKCDDSSQIEGFDAGADLYVTKPFSATLLQAQVSSLLRNRMNLKKEFFSNPQVQPETLGTTEADKAFLENLDRFILAELQNASLSVDDLAAHMGMGRSLFFQKIKNLSGMTPNDYLRTYRLKRAAFLLSHGNLRINEICYEVGFSSPSYFAKRFCQQFGMSPSDYQKKIMNENL